MSESEGETEMVHYPTHERRAFLDWIHDGLPETATIEEHYEPREVSADHLLRRFLLPNGCDDVMPKDACRQVANLIGYDGEASGMTYAIAATVLLINRAVPGEAAQLFLALLFSGGQE